MCPSQAGLPDLPPNTGGAANLFAQGCSLGDPVCCLSVAPIVAKGAKGVPKSPELAEVAITRAKGLLEARGVSGGPGSRFSHPKAPVQSNVGTAAGAVTSTGAPSPTKVSSSDKR